MKKISAPCPYATVMVFLALGSWLAQSQNWGLPLQAALPLLMVACWGVSVFAHPNKVAEDEGASEIFASLKPTLWRSEAQPLAAFASPQAVADLLGPVLSQSFRTSLRASGKLGSGTDLSPSATSVKLAPGVDWRTGEFWRQPRDYDKSELGRGLKEEIARQLQEKGAFDVDFYLPPLGSGCCQRVLGRVEHLGQDMGALVGVCFDSSPSHVFEQELLDAKRTADSAREAKTTFLANVSHEIRTPLASIVGFADILAEKGCAPQEREEAIRIIQRNCTYLANLINSLLDLAKVEAGRMEFECLQVVLRDHLADICATFKKQAEAKGLYLHLQVADSLPAVIETDTTRLTQILNNLLSNAVKFTQTGGVRVDVGGEPLSKPKSWRLSLKVEDTGPGLEKAEKQRLFQPFIQGHCSTARQHGGTGLGLALAKSLAQKMGGDLVLAEAPSHHGTAFIATLVVDQAVDSNLPS